MSGFCVVVVAAMRADEGLALGVVLPNKLVFLVAALDDALDGVDEGDVGEGDDCESGGDGAGDDDDDNVRLLEEEVVVSISLIRTCYIQSDGVMDIIMITSTCALNLAASNEGLSSASCFSRDCPYNRMHCSSFCCDAVSNAGDAGGGVICSSVVGLG